jgi:hypothetical protein
VAGVARTLSGGVTPVELITRVGWVTSVVPLSAVPALQDMDRKMRPKVKVPPRPPHDPPPVPSPPASSQSMVDSRTGFVRRIELMGARHLDRWVTMGTVPRPFCGAGPPPRPGRPKEPAPSPTYLSMRHRGMHKTSWT